MGSPILALIMGPRICGKAVLDRAICPSPAEHRRAPNSSLLVYFMLLAGAIAAMLSAALPASAQVIPPLLQELSEPGQQSYGRSITTDGNTLVVGTSTGFGLNLRFAGQVFYYERVFSGSNSSFVRRGNLLSPNPVAFGGFGVAVDFDDDTLVVGAENEDFAYVFERQPNGGYRQVAALPDPMAPPAINRFGGAVAIDGNRIVIGAWQANSDTLRGGAAYVFERDLSGDWQPTATLQPDAPREGGRFGRSVAIAGDTIVVGDETWGPSIDQAPGAVFFFRPSAGSWTQTNRIVGTASEPNFFGGKIDFDGETLVVTEIGGFTANDLDAGRVYLFDAAGDFIDVLTGTGPGDGFGSSVAVDGDTLLIGSRRDGFEVGAPGRPGAVYEYERNENGVWMFLEKVESLNPQENGAFGASVDVGGGTVVIGASGELTGGAAYAYARSPISDVDLAVEKTADGEFFPFGGPIIYSITVTNEGRQPAIGATVEDLLPPELVNATWNCTASPNALCQPSSGSGDLLSTIDLPAGGSAVYILVADTLPGFEGDIENVTSAAPPEGIVDADPSNNAAASVARVGVYYADGFELP